MPELFKLTTNIFAPYLFAHKKTFDDLQKRKQFLNNACLYASRVYEKSKTLNHEGRIKLQKEIQEPVNMIKYLLIKPRHMTINNLIWTWHFIHPSITENKELHESKAEKPCIPALPNRGSKLGHFYNDTFKFSVCLPTKTGSTNWLKALVALVKVSSYMKRKQVCYY